MGKQALLLRMCLGLSSDLPPDWSTLEEQYRLELGKDGTPSRCFRGIDPERPTSFNHIYDEKGRPFDAGCDVAICKAQNEVLKLAVPKNETMTITPSKEPARTMDRKLNRATWQYTLRTLVYIDRFLTAAWLKSLRYRLLVFSTMNSGSLAELVHSQCKNVGFWTFILSGVPIAVLRPMVEFCGYFLQAKLFSASMNLLQSPYSVNSACKLVIEALPLW